MSDSDNRLTARIVEEIRSDGPMRFDRFMETALFDADDGYYASGKARIGRGGDFFTSVSVGSLFGRLMARQFVDVWMQLGGPDRFTIVEQGGNDGHFAADVCVHLAHEFPGLYAALDYVLVEPFPTLRTAQVGRLQAHRDKVRWVDDLSALPGIIGVHFSNEYVDALPVRLFLREADRWLERRVGLDASGCLAWADGSIVDDADDALPNDLPTGTVVELRPAADDWMRAVAGKLDRGAILTADYGFPRSGLYAPWRTDGTLSCYAGHQRDANPLLAVGEKDLTAHVDFTALALAARDCGCVVAGFADQHHVLISLAEPLLQSPKALDAKERMAFRTLMHPEMMGTQFKYLALTRGMDASATLTGFRHSPGGVARLEIPPREPWERAD